MEYANIMGCIDTDYSSSFSRRSCQSSIREITCERSTLPRICIRPCVYSTLYGQMRQRDTPCTTLTTMSFITVPVSTWRLMSLRSVPSLAKLHLSHADNGQGLGEHFITLYHAQALIITAINEARSMLFTRAAMTAARCARLAHMLGLHRLDDPLESAEGFDGPVLPPPKTWVELEERRRTFWGAYSVNVHVTMNTGWPIMIDVKDVRTST